LNPRRKGVDGVSQDDYEKFLRGKIELCEVLLKADIDKKTRLEGEKLKAESEKQLAEYLESREKQCGE
jgi:hypothetical protein